MKENKCMYFLSEGCKCRAHFWLYIRGENYPEYLRFCFKHWKKDIWDILEIQDISLWHYLKYTYIKL